MGEMIGQDLRVNYMLDVGGGRGEGECHTVGVPVDHLPPLPYTLLPPVVAELVVAVEMPRRDVMTPRAINDPLVVACRDAQHVHHCCNVC